MNTRIFDAFEAREQHVKEYMAGCGMQYGMDCTCGPECRCQNCPIHSNTEGNQGQVGTQAAMNDYANPAADDLPPEMFEPSLQVDQTMDFFGMEPPTGGPVEASLVAPVAPAPAPVAPPALALNAPSYDHHRTQRNPSVISFGNGLRHMSLTSEATFGRAMSGLSALSIDWENLEDFDVDVDHSAHINNSPGKMQDHHHGGRRSSKRRSFLTHGAAAAVAAGAVGGSDAHDVAHVSFKE